jgi:P27 family predicted phage terminase small subunit
VKGRPPKSVEEKRLTGNPGKRDLPAPVLVSGRPEDDEIPAPEWLPAEARDFWGRVVPALAKANIIDTADLVGVEMMALDYAYARRAAAVVDAQGFFVRGSMGQMVEHPALGVVRTFQTQWLRFAEHYALTPVGRTRLGLAQLQGVSLADELRKALGIGEEEGLEPRVGDGAIDAEAREVETCAECGSVKGRRHAEGCSRRRRRKGAE